MDGFIARENGEINWLDNLPNPNKIDHGYLDFLKEVDLIVMGRKTYEKILSFDIDWPYIGYKTIVVSSNRHYKTKTSDTFLLNDISSASIEKLRKESARNIWLVGGGEINTQFLSLQQIDEIRLFVAPVILGNGIKLFPNISNENGFECVSTQAFETGIVYLNYKKKN